ncbi:hypothetical protein D9757_009585 [Collybiopsis confluens]|uniref:Uncharacterized protein n=1 Tax=Collybiopsis confluens TaxID=2823264 RepID=A0A8H5M0Q1_9AGAR|nr:hypothetical protein D9757_009585 [Collybiopsis confluens]
MHPLTSVNYHLKTLFLFTRSDYKTIFFPVLIFSFATSPKIQAGSVLRTVIWIWVHLLQANVSNQTFSGHEDLINKPWRPLPSGRITPNQARALRWCLMILCLCVSAAYGPMVLFASAALTIVEIVHDDVGFSGGTILKNLCNVGGYSTFELGAACSLNDGRLTDTAVIALICSCLIIFTTISAQDFADVEGDKLSGRRTLPIVAPDGSRYYILSVLLMWSYILIHMWGVGPRSGGIFVGMGAYIGSRYFRFREARDDRFSYLLYNASAFHFGINFVSNDPLGVATCSSYSSVQCLQWFFDLVNKA